MDLQPAADPYNVVCNDMIVVSFCKAFTDFP